MHNHPSSKVKRLKTQGRTWQAVGDLLGVSSAMAWKIAHGKADSNHVRAELGLPLKSVEVEPCPQCGEVHKLKHCNKRKRRQSVDRMAARLTPEQGKAAREKLRRMGYDSITDYWLDYIKEEAQ